MMRFTKEELTPDQLLDLFRDVRKGYVSWHNHNGWGGFEFKRINEKWVEEKDPFVLAFRQEEYQRERWLEALRAIRHGRVTADADPYHEGHAVAIMNYHRTESMEWGSGADWETCYVVYESWKEEDGEEYEGEEPWVVIGSDGYP
jgi:hypothetical protein